MNIQVKQPLVGGFGSCHSFGVAVGLRMRFLAHGRCKIRVLWRVTDRMIALEGRHKLACGSATGKKRYHPVPQRIVDLEQDVHGTEHLRCNRSVVGNERSTHYDSPEIDGICADDVCCVCVPSLVKIEDEPAGKLSELGFL